MINSPNITATPLGPTHPRLRNTWVLGRHEAALLGCAYLLFAVAWSALGWLLTRRLSDTWLLHLDRSIATWFVDQRTPTLDSLSFIGSMMADTVVKVVVTGIVAIAMLVHWRRWLEPLMVVVPLVLEAMSFITITFIVDRPRPDVLRLDSSPVGSSFPSGHVAAAAAYSAIAVVIFWRTRSRWVRYTAVAAAALLPIFVSLARMYRGMHYVTDVIMGALLGGVSVLVTALVLRHAADQRPQYHEPDDTMNLTTP